MSELVFVLSPGDDRSNDDGRRARLVTLTGMTGSGKTRLAVEAARRLAPMYCGAVWYVSLSSVLDPSSILEAILRVVSMTHPADTDPINELVLALGGSDSLLVLDNFEQLVEGPVSPTGAQVVQSILDHAPFVSLLVTSQVALNLDGEREIDLDPLAVPRGDENPGELLRYASVQLLVDRARAKRPDFAVVALNCADIAYLCRQLEGIPLALELAAAWSKILTPAQMRVQLADRLRFLVGNSNAKRHRHSSLEVAFEWSYELLPEPLAGFFSGLSVFRAGWSLEAAQAICGEPDALALLRQLGDRSLVSGRPEASYRKLISSLSRIAGGVENAAGPATGAIRFSLLDTLREFGWRKLSAQRRHALGQAHSEYFSRLAISAEARILRLGA